MPPPVTNPTSATPIFSIKPGGSLFPSALEKISDPPHRLYGRGDRDLLDWEPKVAVIGSRSPTEYGRKMVLEIAGELAQAGVCVVSGLALGTDGLAHQAALEAGGKTIAVLGTAIDELRPATNRALAEKILANGLILSEYAPGTPGKKGYFSLRNRIISGLARAVLIVEAAIPSGTLVTANYAIEQDRALFVVPGRVDSPKSAGTLKLLREGGRLVRSATDILEDLDLKSAAERGFENRKPNQYNGVPEEGSILGYLGAEPVSMEELIAVSGLPVAELSQALMEFEIEGRVRKLPGPSFVRG